MDGPAVALPENGSAIAPDFDRLIGRLAFAPSSRGARRESDSMGRAARFTSEKEPGNRSGCPNGQNFFWPFQRVFSH